MPGNLNYVGKVRCPLYDTIPFTAAERTVFEFPEVQRMRRLRQTAFTHYVFPAATHTRFEHSLGVMHMAGIFLTTLVRNQSRAIEKSKGSPSSSFSGSLNDTKTEEVLDLLRNDASVSQTLRFAGLLHDVGHAPFSHSGELFMPTWEQVREGFAQLDLPQWLHDTFSVKLRRVEQKRPGAMHQRVRHEFYSLLLIERVFRQTSGDCLGPEMGQDVCSLLDLDVPVREGSPVAIPGLRTLLSEIISGEIDVDRMDYLRRDAEHCGVVYGLFDAGRILDAAFFYRNEDTRQLHLALHKSGLAAYEDFLRARMSMYQQVYFHKTGTACEAMLSAFRRQVPGFSLPLDPSDYLRFDDHSFSYEIRAAKDSLVASSSAAEVEGAIQLLDDLIKDRRLWKRVYEESHMRTSVSQTPSLTTAVCRLLKREGVRCEMIESETSLSRFSPKGRSREQNVNTLRVLVKSVRGGLSLEALEDHSRLINSLDEERVLKRVFVECRDRVEIESLERRLSEDLVHPEG